MEGKFSRMIFSYGALMISCVLLAGCVTNIAPTSDTNPPPTEALGGFQNLSLIHI